MTTTGFLPFSGQGLPYPASDPHGGGAVVRDVFPLRCSGLFRRSVLPTGPVFFRKIRPIVCFVCVRARLFCRIKQRFRYRSTPAGVAVFSRSAGERFFGGRKRRDAGGGVRLFWGVLTSRSGVNKRRGRSRRPENGGVGGRTGNGTKRRNRGGNGS